jgi:hypothetical protein
VHADLGALIIAGGRACSTSTRLTHRHHQPYKPAPCRDPGHTPSRLSLFSKSLTKHVRFGTGSLTGTSGARCTVHVASWSSRHAWGAGRRSEPVPACRRSAQQALDGSTGRPRCGRRGPPERVRAAPRAAKTWRPGQRVALVRVWSARSDSLGRHRPCRARPADRSRVAEDRSAEGVRGQTGPKTPTGAALGPHTTWATRTTRVTGG